MGNRSTVVSRNISNTTRTEQTYTINSLNQVLSVASRPWAGTTGGTTTTTSYTYDPSGNLSTQTTSANSSGATYAYDDADRLIRFERKNTSGVNDHKSEWVYDGLSRKKVLREFSWVNSAWRLDSAKNYLYDGLDVVQERETLYAADGVTVTSTNQVNFTRTGNIGGILARSTGTSSLTHLFFHYDGSGNVVSLTDSSQNSVAEYSYDAYGNALTATGTQASSNAYRYSTKELHSWTGFYDYGYRFYSPSLGRWINRDPIEEDGGLNLYAAFLNDPVNTGDEYGENPVSDFVDGLLGSPASSAGEAWGRYDAGRASGWEVAAKSAYGAAVLGTTAVGLAGAAAKGAAVKGFQGLKGLLKKPPCPQKTFMGHRRRGAVGGAGRRGTSWKDKRYIVKNWSKQSYPTRAKSAKDHYRRHGTGEGLLTYTRKAVRYWHENRHRGRPVRLSDGSTGIKITTHDRYGIYTSSGKIVSYGPR